MRGSTSARIRSLGFYVAFIPMAFVAFVLAAWIAQLVVGRGNATGVAYTIPGMILLVVVPILLLWLESKLYFLVFDRVAAKLNERRSGR